MFPTIIAVRHDRVVATVSTPRLPATLSAASTMAVGLDPQALVVAAEAMFDGETTALTYAVMTRERKAKWVLQEVLEQDGEVLFSVPVDGGTPPDDNVLKVLAEALHQRPVDVASVARKDRSGTFGEEPFLPPEQGRVVVDAGTVTTLHERVRGIAGQALYLPRSPEAARLAREAGLPAFCVLTGEG